MGRPKVYAQDPGPENNEMPYDFWAFIRWCVNREGLTESSAKVYVSNIRTAFKMMFAEDDALFVQKKKVFDRIGGYIRRGLDVKPFLDKLHKRIEYELEWETFPDLSDDDVERGKTAFLVYREFLEDLAKNPDKYPIPERYETPWKED